MSVIDTTARTARSGVHALRRAISQRLAGGQAGVRDAVDSTGRRAESSLDAIEQAAMLIVDSMARQSSRLGRRARNSVYETEGRLVPRRRRPPIATALLGLGVGLLLTRLVTAGGHTTTGAHAKTR